MKIREEIEKLKRDEGDCESWLEWTTHNGAIGAALRILDKWECVEGAWHGHVYIGYDGTAFGVSNGDLLRFRLVSEEKGIDVDWRPGDHIIILRRRDGVL